MSKLADETKALVSKTLGNDGRFANEKIASFDDGEIIFAEGDESRDLYIIQEGEVGIYKSTDKGEIKLASFKKGDFFGDMALLQGGVRFASAKAQGKTTMLVLQPGGFLLKIRRDPTFAFEMLQSLSYRIKISNDRLIGVIQKGGISKEMVEDILKTIGGN